MIELDVNAKGKENNRITLNIKGDVDANALYEAIKRLLYGSNIIYFDHKLESFGTERFSFRNLQGNDSAGFQPPAGSP